MFSISYYFKIICMLLLKLKTTLLKFNWVKMYLVVGKPLQCICIGSC